MQLVVAEAPYYLPTAAAEVQAAAAPVGAAATVRAQVLEYRGKAIAVASGPLDTVQAAEAEVQGA